MQSYNYAVGLLKEGHRIRMKALGYSMTPFINHGEIIDIKPYHPKNDVLKRYDVILCEVNHMIILHRVMDIGEKVTIKGDHQNHYHEVSLDKIYGIYVDITYMISTYIRKDHMLDISLDSIKRHNLEGMYQDDRALKQAYLMTRQRDAVMRLLESITKSFKDILILKGYALHDIYKDNPYLRAKGDLDLYIKEGHQELGALCIKLGYTLKSRRMSHDTYVSGLLPVEIHYQLEEGFHLKDEMLEYDETLKCFILNEAYQMIYLLLHIKKHLKHGGIGYKHLLDIYYLKPYADMNLIHSYDVSMLYKYITASMDFILGEKISSEIHFNQLIQFISDMSSYGAHGNVSIRMKRLKDIHPLYQRYVHKKGFQALKETLKHNTYQSILKKLKLYVCSKKVNVRHRLYKELGL